MITISSVCGKRKKKEGGREGNRRGRMEEREETIIIHILIGRNPNCISNKTNMKFGLIS